MQVLTYQLRFWLQAQFADYSLDRPQIHMGVLPYFHHRLGSNLLLSFLLLGRLREAQCRILLRILGGIYRITLRRLKSAIESQI